MKTYLHNRVASVCGYRNGCGGRCATRGQDTYSGNVSVRESIISSRWLSRMLFGLRPPSPARPSTAHPVGGPRVTTMQYHDPDHRPPILRGTSPAVRVCGYDLKHRPRQALPVSWSAGRPVRAATSPASECADSATFCACRTCKNRPNGVSMLRLECRSPGAPTGVASAPLHPRPSDTFSHSH